MLKTLIELMIMGGRIWKTDDSVSTRDFSFLSDISLPVLTGEPHSTHTVVVFLDKPARLRFVKLQKTTKMTANAETAETHTQGQLQTKN